MTKEQILNVIENGVKGGQYVSLLKKKDLNNGVVKYTKMRMRLGVGYKNMKVNEGRITGELPWGHWVKGLENYVIENKGNYYLRVTSCDPKNPESGVDIIETNYKIGDEVIDKDLAKQLGGEKSSSASSVYCIKFDNILQIGS